MPSSRQPTRASSRNSSAEVESWAIHPEEPPTLGSDGKYVRPTGQAPVEGYTWNQVRGVWVPGKRLLRQMESPNVPQRQSSSQKRKRNRSNAQKKRKAPRSSKSSNEGDMTVAAAMSLIVTNTQSSMSVDEEEYEEDEEEEEEDDDDDEEEEGYEDEEEQASQSSASASPQPTDIIPEEEEEPELPVVNKIWYHPHSKFEEPVPAYDAPDVTLYEQHRSPRQVPPHVTTGYCSVPAVQQEVRCGICLDCVVRTRIVRECRHRFCEPCVERALQATKECPICRTPIPSRRSLEPDIELDALLRSVIGSNYAATVRCNSSSSDPDAIEGDEENRTTTSLLQQAINAKREAMEKQQLEAEDDASTTAAPRSTASRTEDEGATNSVREEGPALIQLVLQRDAADEAAAGADDALQLPYLRIAGDAPVLVLKNFLRQKHRSKKQYSIWSMLDGGPEILSDMTRLQFVANYLTDDFEGDYMPLYYRETKAGGAHPLV